MTEKERLLINLDNLNSIEPGWDGSNGEIPDERTIRTAKDLISLFNEETLKIIAVFPGNQGGIYIQGRTAEIRISIYVIGTIITSSLKKNELH